MRWTILDYGCNYRRCVCHPLVARQRIDDVADRYNGLRPRTVTRQRSAHLDLGGMCFAHEPVVEVMLAPDRVLTLLRFQAPIIADKLRRDIRRDGWHRCGSWPGFLWFLSNADVRKVLRACDAAAASADLEAHEMATAEALVRANVAMGQEEGKARAVVGHFRSLEGRPGPAAGHET